MNICDICKQPMAQRQSTFAEPYLYDESGLSNVNLIGVTVYSCKDCGVEIADIPNPRGLHVLLAKDILLKPVAQTGEEFRFLRKETGLKPKAFAELLGVDQKTVQNWENAETLSRQNDLSVRVLVLTLLRERHKARFGTEYFKIPIPALPDTLIEDTWISASEDVGHGEKIDTYLGVTAVGWEIGPLAAA